MPWPNFVAHAVGLQYCAAKSVAQLDDAFWSWLEARPELLLTLAATAYPVQAKIWENLQRLWQESEFRAAAESNPEFASHMVGFAYMQRKTSVDGHPLQLHWATAHGDGDLMRGHSGKFADGTPYGVGKTPKECVGHDNFPERDEHPTAVAALKYRLKLGGSALSYPWPMVPLGYYAPIRECDWFRQNPGARCRYTLAYLKWNSLPASQNPTCKSSSWHPSSVPRIAEDGRVCGGCSYFDFAKQGCLGKVAGRRPEPGHSGDFILSTSGSGKSRTFSVSSPWMVTAGYKRLNGNNNFHVTLIETFVRTGNPSYRWFGGVEGTWSSTYQGGLYADLQALAVAVGQGKMPKYNAARLAGMFAEHTYWYTDEGTRQTLLKPLAERALKLSPSDTHLWRLVFKLNSKLKTYAGRSREADLAMSGAILQNLDPASSSAASSSLLKDPGALAEKFRLCHVRDGSWKTGCNSHGALWFPRQGSRMSGKPDSDLAWHKSGGKDMSFALLRVGSEMNRSGLSGAYGSVEKLVELAAEMEPSDEFRELWEKFESDVLSVWADGPEAREPLRELLENLPVGYVDRASAFRLDSDMQLLELCPFRVVAASVEKNFPEATEWVSSARAVLSDPTTELRGRLTGRQAHLDEFFSWLDAGKPADGVRTGPGTHEDPDKNVNMFEWLEMMSKEHLCNSKGVPSALPIDEAGDDEAEEDSYIGEDTDTDTDADTDTDFVKSSYDMEIVQSSSDAEVDACYEDWLTSEVAARLKKYLDEELR